MDDRNRIRRLEARILEGTEKIARVKIVFYFQLGGDPIAHYWFSSLTLASSGEKTNAAKTKV
jgi:hypothetical protein